MTPNTRLSWDDDPTTLVERLADLPRSGSPAGLACIRVVDGARIGERFPLPRPELGCGLLIGRAPSMDVVLGDPTVSRVHASIEWSEGGARLNDHGSTNGTWLGARKIQTHPLQNGDRFRVGHTTFAFGFEAQPTDSPPMAPPPVIRSRVTDLPRRREVDHHGPPTVPTTLPR